MVSTETLWFMVAIGATIGILMLYLLYDTLMNNDTKDEDSSKVKDRKRCNTNRNGGKWF